MLPFGSKSQVKVLEQEDDLAAALLHEKRHWWTDSAPEGQKSAKIRHIFAKSCAKNGVPLLTEDRPLQRAPVLTQEVRIPLARG